MHNNDIDIIYIDAIAELPDNLFSEIGRVIVWYAYLEGHLSQIIQIILDIDEAESRIATREPRATDRMEIIESLLNYKKIKTSVNFKSLLKSLDDIQKKRNLLAHNCWVTHPETKEIVLGVFRGKRSDNSKIDRRIIPETITFGISECKKLSNDIDKINESISVLKKDIFHALPSLQKKYEQRFPHQFQNQDYIPLRHTNPLQSSEE
jgi:phosphoenolpyruvate carboxylase